MGRSLIDTVHIHALRSITDAEELIRDALLHHGYSAATSASKATTPPATLLPDLGRAHAFAVVSEELHFHRAAERLSISQAPLFRLITEYERELRVKLFDRSRRGLRLTTAGTILQCELVRIIISSNRVVENIRTVVHTS